MRKINNEEYLIEYYAKKVLNELGEIYTLESIENDDSNETYHGKYIGYGLEINALYTNSDCSNLEDLNIEFNNREVYSKRNKIMVRGTWQEVLKTIKEKIPYFKEERKETIRKKEHAKELYKNYIKPIHKKGIKLSQSIEYDTYEKYNPYHTYGDSTTLHRIVKQNGKVVLNVSEELFDFYIEEYTPGNWEQEVINFYQKRMNKGTEEEKEKATKELIKLRKLK